MTATVTVLSDVEGPTPSGWITVTSLKQYKRDLSYVECASEFLPHQAWCDGATVELSLTLNRPTGEQSVTRDEERSTVIAPVEFTDYSDGQFDWFEVLDEDDSTVLYGRLENFPWRPSWLTQQTNRGTLTIETTYEHELTKELYDVTDEQITRYREVAQQLLDSS